MTFYKLRSLMATGIVQVEWFGSEREAVVRRLALFNGNKLAGKKKESKISIVDIPVRKKELLEWLKENCV